ncbi:MAG: LON peptidase substrate-binding domain-containing protein, partial [Hyphomicrobiales bacterium]|nr:LON peptidase substrate-binding domain-containing protein [Hyphomicrobiales bacterium]
MNFRQELLRAMADEGSNAAGGAAPTLPADALIIVPVRDAVLMPGTVFPITVVRPRSIAAAQQAVREERQIGVLMQRDSAVEDPSALDLHRTGAIANVLRYVTSPDGVHHLVLQAVQRFRVVDFVRERPFFAARVERIEEPDQQSPEIEARFRNLKQQALETLQLLPQAPRELVVTVQAITSPGAL